MIRGDVPPPVVSAVEARASRLSAESRASRLQSATEEAELLEAVLVRVRGGASRRAALEAAGSERPYRTMLARLRSYEEGGRDALIDRRLPLGKELKLTPEVRGAIRVVVGLYPTLGSGERSARVGGKDRVSEIRGLTIGFVGGLAGAARA